MISVVMRTFNNSDIIKSTIVSLFSQQSVSFEFIVIDSGSTDGTMDIVSDVADILIQIDSSSYTPSYALNLAISKASSEEVVLLNSDTVLLDPFSLSRLLLNFKEQSLDALTGRQVARPDAYPEVEEAYLKCFPVSGSLPSWITLSAPIALLRKSIWRKYPFYKDAWGSEDSKLGQDLINAGLRVGYASDVTAMHSHNYSSSQLFSRSSVEGDADVFIYSRKFSFSLLLRNIFSEVYRHFYSNIINFNIRAFKLYIPIIKALGYNYGVIKGSQRKINNCKKLYSNSYQ